MVYKVMQQRAQSVVEYSKKQFCCKFTTKSDSEKFVKIG